MRNPRFSIIIPVFNDQQGLESTIKSLQIHGVVSSSEFEIIVVFDGCKTQKRFDHIRSIYLNQNTGSYSARNRGIEESKGEYLVFLDAGVIISESWRSNILNMAGDYIVGSIRFPSDPKNAIESFQHNHSFRNDLYFDKLHFGVTANLIIKRSVFEEIGKFLPVKSGGDAEFGHRISKHDKYQMCYRPELLVYHPYRKSIHELVVKYYRVGKGQAEIRHISSEIKNLHGSFFNLEKENH